MGVADYHGGLAVRPNGAGVPVGRGQSDPLPAGAARRLVRLIVLLVHQHQGDGRERGRVAESGALGLLVLPILAATPTRRISAGILWGAGLLVAARGSLWLGCVAPEGGPAAVPVMLVIGLGIALP